MKKFFNTRPKAVISIICIVVAAFIIIAAISILAIRTSLISKSEASDIALRDAGLSESEASGLRTRLDFDDRCFQYEVDFYNNGTEYEYVILAKNGDIIARNIEGDRNENNSGKNVSSNPENQTDESNPESQTGASTAESNQKVQTSNQPVSDVTDSAQSQEISLDAAKAAALADANLTEADVTFTKTKLDDNGHIRVYDIEFYTSDMKYDYEIDAYNGTVLEKENEAFGTQPESFADNNADNAGNGYIGVDRAKEIALNSANLSETDVQFVKAKLENDDGKVEYEIEFYFNGTEYSYTVDAVSGDILEYDVDHD